MMLIILDVFFMKQKQTKKNSVLKIVLSKSDSSKTAELTTYILNTYFDNHFNNQKQFYQKQQTL